MRLASLAQHRHWAGAAAGIAALGVIGLLSLLPSQLSAAPTKPGVRMETPSGLPVPRFVSIKAARTNVRQGPSPQHAIVWIYVRRGIPVEVVAETLTWRRIRDVDGAEGWVHANLLDGARTAVVIGKELVPLRRKPEADADAAAWAEPGLVARLIACDGAWCEISAQNARGWIARAAIWGVLPDETIE